MIKSIITIIGVVATTISLAYRGPNYHGPYTPSDDDSRAANCAPANERLFMEFNNIRALIETGGSLWQDRANGGASYEVPKGSNKHVLYSGALWMGGEDANGQLKIAAHMYRQGNDFWGGPLGSLVPGSGNYEHGQVQSSDFPLVRDHGAAEIIPSQCTNYDRFFTIRKSEVQAFIAWWECDNGYADNPDDCDEIEPLPAEVMNRIENWPAHGDITLGEDYYLAPFYDRPDESGYANGRYDPINDGDYPWYDIEGEIDCRNDRRVTLFGDETHWWVFNDKGNIHTETGGDAIGMEVRAQAFAFATDDAINDMTFYNYELINRGTQRLKNTYFGQWVDSDIGNFANDFVGCDVARGLGFGYNGVATDNGWGGQEPYGASPPAIGVDFFEGPYKDNDGMDNPLTTDIQTCIAEEGIPYAGLGLGYGDGIVDNERIGMAKFVYFTSDGGAVRGDPSTATEFYQYLTGHWKNNAPFTFGGNGSQGTVPTNYCFPGDSDPYNWGTAGVPVPGNWSEPEVPNPPGDRRFLQSAGPFTLEPGAVNNITVGVVYGRNTAETDLLASVRTMKAADSKAQALFDNCFEIVEPPKAPFLTCQEMENEIILFLQPGEDEQNWYSIDKINIITPDHLIDQGIFYDDTFRFEGYQVYQLANNEVSVGDLDDVEKARLVGQCDVQNGVSKLVNYTYDEQLQITIPAVKVDGADEGLQHSFHVTEDLFATGDRRLVNHKKYYFMAIAYGHNDFKTYDPNDPDALDGQKLPYLRSRLSAVGGEIEPVLAIPHDPTPEANGTNFTTSYGYQPPITQIEGIGNGGHFTELDSVTVNDILLFGGVDHPTYKSGSGPIDVKVIDPLNLAGGDYVIRFGQDSSSIDEDTWTITRTFNGVSETIESDYTIGVRNEQIILDWGISVTVNQQFYEGSGSCTSMFTDPLEARITYEDSSKAWLTGVPDDDQFYPTNWIRSGSTDENTTDNPGGCLPSNWIYNQCAYNDYQLDPEQEYEKLLDGTVAPFNRVGAGVYGMPFGWPGDDPNQNEYQNLTPSSAWFTLWQTALTKACFPELHDVDIVITRDPSKWTRCPVIELNDNENQTEYPSGSFYPSYFGDEILQLRSDLSVGKDGLPDGSMNDDGSPSRGMGWFPGYAIDVNTGKRLNMAFGENSWLLGENGSDMIWNPTTNFADQVGNPLFGGMHYVYVFGENVDNSECPIYDEGRWLQEKLSHHHDGNGRPADMTQSNALSNGDKNTNYFNVWKSCQWVMEPMLIPNTEFLGTDVEINLRINKPYEERLVDGTNNSRPMYEFTIEAPTAVNDGAELESVLDNINVVPNPYYGYSEYETSKLDNTVKITNLPEKCKISIFNMQGALIRNFAKDDPMTSLDWDLKNNAGIPIAGGLYIIHIKLEENSENGLGVRERIIKWYGALRVPDLDNL